MRNSMNEYAVIDLGSNSFHMFIARLENGRPVILQRIKDKVRLAQGLDEDNHLSLDAMQRGWVCLQEFAEHLQNIAPEHRQVVATATLRLAQNRHEFIERGESILDCPIQIISGLKEADYIYRGATEHLPNQRHLILDIGGASTELIVGIGTKISYRVSFDMGCVTFMQRYFSDQEHILDNIVDAINAAKELLLPEQKRFIDHGWDDCFGASGTPQALNEIKQFHQDNSAITLAFLQQQASALTFDQQSQSYQLPGMTDARQAVFPAGLAILIALFEVFAIPEMGLAEGALREGLLYEIAERSN